MNRPDTAASRFVLKTDTEDRARALTCLAQAVYYEAAGEGLDGAEPSRKWFSIACGTLAIPRPFAATCMTARTG